MFALFIATVLLMGAAVEGGFQRGQDNPDANNFFESRPASDSQGN